MFAMAANDRAPLEQSKKLGSLHIVDQLFKIYFKVSPISKPLLMCGKLVLCSSIRFICVEIWYEPLKVRHSRLLSDSAEPIKSRISITLDVSQCLKISITKRRNAWIMLGNIVIRLTSGTKGTRSDSEYRGFWGISEQNDPAISRTSQITAWNNAFASAHELLCFGRIQRLDRSHPMRRFAIIQHVSGAVSG